MFKYFSEEEKEYIEKEYKRLFEINNITDTLKEKYKLLLNNVFNYNKYVKFEENCKIINSINNIEKVESNVIALVLKSNMNNIKEGLTIDIYKLNELYIKDYEETKDTREIEEWRDGTRFLKNPFHKVQILLMLKKDNEIYFADKFDFCTRTELKSDIYEALKYHYVPSVIRDINKCIKQDKEQSKYKFEFCNNYSFEEIKNSNIDDLDYEKAHDLATIENKDRHISVYLGVYEGEFELTYSIHSKNDFDSNLENIEAEYFDMSKINNDKELKDTMTNMLISYFEGKEIEIDRLSEELDEEYLDEENEV